MINIIINQYLCVHNADKLTLFDTKHYIDINSRQLPSFPMYSSTEPRSSEFKIIQLPR